MSNTIDWGKASVNNTIDYGQGAIDNTINWGKSQTLSPSGETNITGTPSTPSFQNLNSFSFDGVDEYFLGTSTYSELDGQNNFTFSFWIKPTLNNSKVVFSIGNNSTDSRAQQFYCYIKSNGQMFLYLKNMSTYCRSTSGVISANVWQHVLICRNSSASVGSKAKIFVNAVDVTNAETTRYYNNTTNATTSLYIGEHTNGYLNPFLGNIDEFAIWSGTDLRNDVATIYNNGIPTDLNDNGLTAPTTWQRMGEDATWNGATWTMTDVNGGYTNRSINMVEANRTTDVPTIPFSTRSIALDGVDDYVSFGDNDNLSFGNGVTDSPFSISAWIKPVDNARFRIAFKWGTVLREYYFHTAGGGALQVSINSTASIYIGRNGQTTISENVWSHVICTYDGSGNKNNVNIYLNGVLDNGSTTSSGTYTAMSNTLQPFEIGRYNGGSYADGSIDEVSVFNTELSQSEVTSIYNSGVPNDISSLNPLSWWRCGDGDTAPILIDNGSGGNNGTMTNFTTFSTDVPT